MRSDPLKLSILDQSPVAEGSSPAQALQNSIELARHVDRLGYSRFWMSEHHAMQTLACTAPEILLARMGAETQRIRIGSGGIMMPNHSTLKVAENFRMLEALFPGRVDLGMGRAPGTDRLTASILNPSNQFSEQEFINQLYDLVNYFHDRGEPGTAQGRIRAIPQVQTVPGMWLLSSSGESGLFAAHFGMGLSFAHFINPIGGPQAVKAYRERFKPSEDQAEPAASVAIFVYCSKDDEKLRQHQALMDFRFNQFEQGKGIVPVGYDDVKDHVYTELELERIRHNRKRVITGKPAEMRQKLTQLAEEYDVDEIIAVTITEQFEDRLESYKLLAGQFDL